jgi:hypothetical protein
MVVIHSANDVRLETEYWPEYFVFRFGHQHRKGEESRKEVGDQRNFEMEIIRGKKTTSKTSEREKS